VQINRNTRYGRLMSQLGLRSGFMENLISSLGIGKAQARPLQIPSADLFSLYINDYSINTQREGVWMGLEKGEKTNWSYYVPSVGEIFNGKVARDTGAPDSPVRLYPRKRNVVFTRSCRIYDNTSIYWHGMFPVAKLTLDPWPWSWFGKSPLKDLLPLHKEMQKVMRVLSRHLDRIKRPGVAADKNVVSEKSMKAIDPEMPGLKVRFNPTGGRPFEMLYEPNIDPFVMQYGTTLEQMMDKLAGNAAAMQAIAELNQLPQLDTVERLIGLMGQVNRLRSLVIEAFMSEFAMMLLMNFFQFYSQAQRIAILGPSGQTWEDFDYDPENMIPSDIGQKMPDGSLVPRYERAREFYRYFTYQISPGSLLNSASVQDKLMMLTLMRAGVVDPITALEKLGVGNLGLPQDVPSGILPRLMWCKKNGLMPEVNSSGRKASGQAQPRIKMSES